ncbi:MAG: (5-formylfuran-3-yl)methyl phosphate synthase [Fimbriiglobus sp.]
MSEKAKKAATSRRTRTSTSTTTQTVTPTRSAPKMPAPPKAKLLISVRTPDEAGIALEGGADLIDVKEPAKGSLGMAHHETVAGVLEVVNGRVPVSAALGEWSENILTEAHWHLELPLTYVKWGLKGYIGGPGWGEDLLQTKREIPAGIEVVATAYADWEKAQSVPPLEVAKFAKRFRYKAFLLDTFQKDGRTLFDFMPVGDVIELIDSLKRGGVIVALGGSLKPEQVKLLGNLAPDYYAVRGSVCVGGKRDAELDPVRMKKWKETLG